MRLRPTSLPIQSGWIAPHFAIRITLAHLRAPKSVPTTRHPWSIVNSAPEEFSLRSLRSFAANLAIQFNKILPNKVYAV
jgi:hypothetical protein